MRRPRLPDPETGKMTGAQQWDWFMQNAIEHRAERDRQRRRARRWRWWSCVIFFIVTGRMLCGSCVLSVTAIGRILAQELVAFGA